LYSGSSDNTIRVWNTETHETIAILGTIGGSPLLRQSSFERKGHTESVLCLAIHENKLFSGSCDRTIRAWNTETHETIAILGGDNGPMGCLTLHENKLYSGSYGCDKIIRVWNTETYEQIATLEGNVYSPCGLTIHENKLYYGGGSEIYIWNTETHEPITILRGHTWGVTRHTLQENKLYSGGCDGNIRVWKV